MRKSGWKRLSRRAVAVVCESIICPPACPSYPPALPLSARASLPPFISMILAADEAEASFPPSSLIVKPSGKSLLVRRKRFKLAPSEIYHIAAAATAAAAAPPLSLCQNCRYFAFLPSFPPSSRPSFVLASMKTAMKIWPDRRPTPSSPLSTIFRMHCLLPQVAGLGKFGAIGITNECARPRRAFFLEVSAPLGRSIGSFPPSERDLGRRGGSER